jgi:hypothetical protein
VITQNGEAKAVLQDVRSYEQTQETLALLKILALGNQEIEAGQLNRWTMSPPVCAPDGKAKHEQSTLRGAEHDLESIYDYIAECDSPASLNNCCKAFTT